MRSARVFAVLLLLAGCGRPLGEDPADAGGAGDPGVAWATGDRIRLASGAERTVDDEVLWFAETAEGVAYLSGEEGEASEEGLPFGWRLVLDDGSGDDVELAPDASRPVASPDGRWLAWNELNTDRRQVRLDLVLYDVTSGERSTPYPPDTGIGATRLTDDLMYVTTFDDTVVLDLSTGRSRPARGEDAVLRAPQLSSPDGRWRTLDQRDGVASVEGEEVDLEVPGEELRVEQWVDDDTVVGVVPDVPTDELGTDETTGGALVACEVPSGACAEMPGVPDSPAPVLLTSSEHPVHVGASGPSGYED